MTNMMNFREDRGGGFRDRGSSGGFGRGGGGFRGGGFGRDRGPVEMHDVICSKCGQECQVPFKPTGDKPVFCSDCFKKEDGGRDRSSRSGSGGMSPEQINQINEKLDKIMKALNIE